MSQDKYRKSLIAVVAGMALLMLAVGILTGPIQEASADTVPTPAAHNPSSSALYVPFWSASAKTASAGSNSYQLMTYELLDVQWIIDQGTTNTATLTIQWSNDNTNWSDGPALVSNNVADADGMVQVSNLGRYTRVYATLGNSNPITLTVKAIAK